MIRITLISLAGAVSALWAFNASVFAPRPEGSHAKIIAHRGVSQTYHRVGLTNETCTAARIDPPTHGFLENTIPSMRAAFDAGADVVEIDIHRTTDGRFAVFHDWTLDCRTEGTGETRKKSLAELKALDIGYGYTADGGRTYPFRGKGVGLLPSLDEVLAAVPDGRFLINFKSNDARDGEAFVTFIAADPKRIEQIWGVYGGGPPIAAVRSAYPQLYGTSRRRTKDCLVGYLATGWFGRVPPACHGDMVLVPISHTKFVWGWPRRFEARMRSVGATVVLAGPYENGDPGTRGVDDEALLSGVPQGFDGYVWTNRVEVVGPLMARERTKETAQL